MSSNREMIELVNRLIIKLKQDELTTQELTFILIQFANLLATQSHDLHEMDKIRLNFSRRSPENGSRRRRQTEGDDEDEY